MNPRKLFIASCLSLVVTAMIFSIRGDIGVQLRDQFQLTNEQLGGISAIAFLGFAVAILCASAILDIVGLRAGLYLSFCLHMFGLVWFIFAGSYSSLYWSMLIAGFGNGMVEAVINPLAASLYPKDKTKYMNILHAWWPGGIIIGGLLSLAMGKMGLAWQVQMGIVLIPTVIYGYLIFGQHFPETERVDAGVSHKDMWLEALKPGFLLLMFCMMITASIELAPGQWVGAVLMDTVGMSGTWVLVYGSALMFILRFFAGPIAHAISPIGMMVASTVIAGIGLWLLSLAETPGMAFVMATVFYVGVCFMWPTMLGIAAERYPRGGAFTIGLLGFAGQLALAMVIFRMGSVFDTWGAAASFQFVAKLSVIVFVIFLIMWVRDYMKGGYKAIDLREAAVDPTQPETESVL